MINSLCRQTDEGDVWRWNLASNGKFTIKELTKILEEKMLIDGKGQLETMRNNLISKKVEIFIWRAMEKRLPTLVELDKRGIDLHSIRCPICDEDVETIDHSLIFCNSVMDIWSRVYRWWGFGNMTNLSVSGAFLGNCNITCSELGTKIWQAIEWTCGYLIWRNRNNKIFKNKSWNAPTALSEIQILSFDWISRRLKDRKIDWHVWLTSPQEYLN
ncbi:uncharacterized protein [Rutidosis leptorrhynchoides]|uniref:uncharacterized protein n=1 Tax=Rutidosis leptorrhynchoides TaxID=125765 RepID=UPI003A98E49E